MNEKGATMQSEGLDEPPPTAGSPMTFTEPSRAGDTPSPIKDALTSDDSKTDHLINFEDDIEKVEVSSNETSDEDVDDAVPEQHPNESIKNWLQRITDLQKKLEPAPQKPSPQVQQQPSRVVKFQDLPYMGEMTLDNSKPRRGRKPKKADICHLIYKNYGTIFPGTPNPKSYLENAKKSDKDDANRSDVQNRIISSLLEKRLTQEIKKTDQVKKVPSSPKEPEPLNLCIRDLNHLKIRFLKKTDNTYTSEIKSEPQSDDDVEFVQETPPIKPEVFGTQEEAPGGYVYWPNAGVFIHPMALQQQLMYYQRMAANNSYTLPNHSPRPPPEELGHQELRKIIPKTRHHKKEDETETQKTKRTSTCPDKTPAKRKRSAIFIPPIPAESNTNPATEVSICKFKFTGGAKPSLQEKKMLSVDSGGNFRYYSGTGDKSMRGYEFFPRETLQQQVNNTQGSSTGAFLQASGEKIFTPDFPKPEFLLSPAEIPQTSPIQESQRHKSKRKSRKSLQREKLEQTFKEKGFLIQTQQLESAEGATYCKFRQLRKFTRYLFRSWKDYLPGNVRELQEGEKIDPLGEDGVEPDVDNASRHSSELSTNCAQL